MRAGVGDGPGVVVITGRVVNLLVDIGFANATGKCNNVRNKDETRR